MSTKSKASSKNKKAVAKKASAKKTNDKKKVAKPAAKSKSAKKTTVKAKPVAKKAVPAKAKPAVKKATVTKKVTKAKPSAKKVAVKAKAVAKKVVSKKPVKKVAAKKAPIKKASVKPAVKVVKKVVVKAKPTPKKVDVKVAKAVKAPKPTPAPKKAVKEVVKVEASVKEKKVKVAPAPIKKQIVAPTTFRVDESASAKNVKEPNGKFEMEFVVRASEDMVFEFVSTESGLSEWFCDDVNIRNGIFTFAWDGQTQQAKLVKEVPPMFIRYQWLDKNDGSYFEFKIQKDELTNDISLIITDFADNKADEESARLLWHSQVDKLLHVLGSFF